MSRSIVSRMRIQYLNSDCVQEPRSHFVENHLLSFDDSDLTTFIRFFVRFYTENLEISTGPLSWFFDLDGHKHVARFWRCSACMRGTVKDLVHKDGHFLYIAADRFRSSSSSRGYNGRIHFFRVDFIRAEACLLHTKNAVEK